MSIRRRWQVEQYEQRMKKDARIQELLGGVTSGISRVSVSSPVGGSIDRIAENDSALPRTSSTSKSPPDRLYIVPRDRVKDFVGRETQLDEISAYFAKSSTQRPQVLVLHALGGQGKSQIVLECCQRWREKYRGIFWINASSEDLALQSYARIVSALKGDMSAGAGDKDRMVEIVKSHLEDWNEAWLMVFDNYDQPDVFPEIRRFFPKDPT
ncbi:MAG: hypothetical protein Q9224_007730 [Gallowayella concinna]